MNKWHHLSFTRCLEVFFGAVVPTIFVGPILLSSFVHFDIEGIRAIPGFMMKMTVAIMAFSMIAAGLIGLLALWSIILLGADCIWKYNKFRWFVLLGILVGLFFSLQSVVGFLFLILGVGYG